MIAHIVLARWNEGVTRQQIEKARHDFLALTAKIPGIEAAHWGTRPGASLSDYPDGVVIFAQSVDAIDAYHAHPDHVPFAEMIGAMASVLVGGNYDL